MNKQHVYKWIKHYTHTYTHTHTERERERETERGFPSVSVVKNPPAMRSHRRRSFDP